MKRGLAELVNELFRTHRRPDGREFTNREVSRALNGELEHSYLGKIRSGKVENPSRNTLLLLCQFFSSVGEKVEPNYFFPELETSHDVDDVLLTESEVDDILAKQAAELEPDARRKLAAFLRVLNRKRS